MDTEFVETELNGVKLRVFKDGTIMRYITKLNPVSRSLGWNICKPKLDAGYYRIRIKNKKYRFHRIIAMVYLEYDINDKLFEIDHIDGCTSNNNVSNLRIVTHQENMWNICETKGYYWNKYHKRWIAKICVNGKRIHIGSFNTEEEARTAYLEAKAKYHIIHHHPHQLVTHRNL